MKSKKWLYYTFGLVAAIALGFSVMQTQKKETGSLDGAKTEVASLDVDKISESLGHLIVRHLDNPGFKFNIDKIVVGIKDEKAGKPSPMSEEEYEQAIATIQENIFTSLAEKNLKDATAFLEKNAKEEGVIALNPKLQYKLLQSGEGEEVTLESTPLIHYTGKLIDGSTFSSSKESGQPIALPMKQTIPGFSEGMNGMKKGEKRMLYIHPELAYGVSGHLPPNSLLIFEVEIVEAQNKPAEMPKCEENPTAELDATAEGVVE